MYTLGSRQNVGGTKKLRGELGELVVAGGWGGVCGALAHPPANQPPKVTAVVVIREQLAGGTGAHGHTGVIERGQGAEGTSEDWLPIECKSF